MLGLIRQQRFYLKQAKKTDDDEYKNDLIFNFQNLPETLSDGQSLCETTEDQISYLNAVYDQQLCQIDPSMKPSDDEEVEEKAGQGKETVTTNKE